MGTNTVTFPKIQFHFQVLMYLEFSVVGLYEIGKNLHDDIFFSTIAL